MCAWLVFSFGLLAAAQKPPEHETGENADSPRQRMDWFYQQRAYPLGFIPRGARSHALQQFNQMAEAEGKAGGQSGSSQSAPGVLTATPVPGGQWTLIGPEPTNTPYSYPLTSGRISALAVVPGTASTVYLGGAQGGVWKTTNSGTNWTPLTDNQPSLAIGSIALDPTNSSIVYVGTGEENFSGDSYYGAGILKSTDGGSTWSQLGGSIFAGPFQTGAYYGGGGRVGAIAVDPGNNQIVLAAAQVYNGSNGPGIYRSTNGGTSWTNVLPNATGTAAFFDPTNGTIAYAALGETGGSSSNGVYRSADSGATWARPDMGSLHPLPTTNVGRIALALAPSSTTTLYAAIQNTSPFGSLLGVWKSTDSGADWTQLTVTDFCTPQCWYDIVVAVDPANASYVYAGGSANNGTLFRSPDGGTTWAEVDTGLHVDHHAVAFASDGSKVYVGNDGGVWSSTDVTNTTVNWTNLNSTLAVTQFYPGLSFHPTNPNIAIGGTQDNGTQLYSGTLGWNNVTCGDGGWAAIDPSTPATIYAACQNIQILKSTTGGAFGTWSSAQSGIAADRSQFIPPLVIDSATPARLYFGTYRVWQTTNGAGSWTAISPDLTAGGTLTTIAVAPSDSNTVYVGSSDAKVQVTTNAGMGASATWTDITSTLPNRSVTMVAVDPLHSLTAYVTFSGFSGFGGDNQGHVFKTTTGGTSWTDISGNLPNTPVNDIAIDPDLPNTFYVGTDVGVFSTINGGTTWSTLSSGLPTVAVLGLKFHRPSRTLRAVTHGRSVWDLSLKKRRGQLVSE